MPDERNADGSLFNKGPTQCPTLCISASSVFQNANEKVGCKLSEHVVVEVRGVK